MKKTRPVAGAGLAIRYGCSGRDGANNLRICLDHSMIWTTRRLCGSTSTARLFTTV